MSDLDKLFMIVLHMGDQIRRSPEWYEEVKRVLLTKEKSLDISFDENGNVTEWGTY